MSVHPDGPGTSLCKLQKASNAADTDNIAMTDQPPLHLNDRSDLWRLHDANAVSCTQRKLWSPATATRRTSKVLLPVLCQVRMTSAPWARELCMPDCHHALYSYVHGRSHYGRSQTRLLHAEQHTQTTMAMRANGQTTTINMPPRPKLPVHARTVAHALPAPDNNMPRTPFSTQGLHCVPTGSFRDQARCQSLTSVPIG